MSGENSNDEDLFTSTFIRGFSQEYSEVVEYDDYNRLFENGGVFTCRADAEKWVRDIGAKHNMFFTIESSKQNRVYIGCECSGNYKPIEITNDTDVKSRSSIGSKKRQCPFQVVLRKNKDNLWVVCTKGGRGKHNHALGKYENWHTSRAKLKSHEIDIVREEYFLGTRPKVVLDRLSNGGVNYSNARHIYNANQKIQREEMRGFSPIQFFFKLLRDNGWYQQSRPAEGSNNVGDIIFADKKSLEVCRSFPQVLILDSTYKTNRYDLPLFEVIGIVPTGQNFHVAFAYLQNEKTENYTWVMEMLKLFLFDIREPRVFVTDRELALMNAIHIVFPAATNLLCRRHIGVDTQKNLAQLVHSKEYEGSFRESWYNVVNASTLEEYETAVTDLGEKWHEYPKFLQYLHNTWLTDHHQRFVSAWTNQHMHFGTLTTNRVESAHIQLKRELGSTRSDLHRIWRKIAKVVDMQLKAIKGEFEKCKTVHPHVTRLGIFQRLGGTVSHKAIEILHAEISYSPDWNPHQCNCALRTTHGLPCACEITRSANLRIPIDPVDIDLFWRTLDFEGNKLVVENEERDTAHDLLDRAVKLYKEQASDAEVRIFTERVLLECNPEWTSLDAPISQQRKGRPKNAIGQRIKSFMEKNKKDKTVDGKEKECGNGKQKEKRNATKDKHDAAKEKQHAKDKEKTKFPTAWERYMPRAIIPYITGCVDVAGDGNCGFRALSHFLFGDEQHWSEIRFQLQLELEGHADSYRSVFGQNVYETIVREVNWHYRGTAPTTSWMDVNNHGVATATAFQSIVVCYARNASSTYLPLRWNTDPDNDHPSLPNQIITIGHLDRGVDSAHYILLELREGYPLPSLCAWWIHQCQPRLKHWKDLLLGAGMRPM